MRVIIAYGINIYAVFYSLYLLTLNWGWSALLLLLTGPLVAIFAPLLVWITTGDYLYFALITIGNLLILLTILVPEIINRQLPKNKITSSIRTLLIACFSFILISQGISLIGVTISVVLNVVLNNGATNALAYILSVIGGIYGGYCYVNLHKNSEFYNFTSKNILFICSIPLILIIGWRGSPRRPDEPQHQTKGKITLQLLNHHYNK